MVTRPGWGTHPMYVFVLFMTTLPLLAAPPRTFTFTLTGPCKTSAGVYAGNGTLVRTLWSGRRYAVAGQYFAEWDGKLDDHYGVVSPAPEGPYTLKVLANNVQYHWDGVIGNTTATFTGNDLWRGLCAPMDMEINGNGVGIMMLGQNEGQAPVKRFSTADPLSPLDVEPANPATNFNHVAIDRTRYYMAVCAHWESAHDKFITARNIADNSPYTFPQGKALRENSSEYSGIDVYPDDQGIATGLAVQQDGNVLAVSHGSLNLIKMFDKTTGAFRNQIAITNPGRITFAPNGDLWVITGTTLSRFAATTLGQTNTPDATITGLTSPLAIRVYPADNNKLLVLDGGASQQVKCYTNIAGWQVQWTLGQRGGYNAANGPDVTTDKFAISPQLAIQADGSFWVGDYGNYRILHFSNTRTYLGQIAWLQANYKICADPNVPSRVIAGAGYHEFHIDYTKPLTPGDPGATGAWKLVKNWTAGIDTARYDGIRNVVTLNGVTYAQLQPRHGDVSLARLPSKGILQFLPADAPGRIYNTGETRHEELVKEAGYFNTMTIYSRAGTGFDTGNPTWSTTLTPLGAVPHVHWNNDPTPRGSCGMSPIISLTTTNKIILHNATTFDDPVPGSYHLGAIQVGDKNWAWRAGPGKAINAPDGQGSYSTLGDALGGVNGLAAFAIGRDIVWGYNGQYCGFSDQFAHVYDNGLFVGQFGVPGNDSTVPGCAGNITAMDMVKFGDTLYVYLSDESVHGGAHRWSISGLDTIQEITGAVSAHPADPSDLIALPASRSHINMTWADNSTTETGFIIDRATDRGFTQNVTRVTITDANVTSYADTNGLRPLTHYFYRVRATNAAGTSAPATGNTIPADKLTGKVIVYGGQWDGNSGPEKAFDGEFTTYYDANLGHGSWLGLDLGAPTTITMLKYSPRLGLAGRMLGGKFQASSTPDFSDNVVDLSTITTYPPDHVYTVRYSTAVARYIRYLGGDLPGMGSHSNISEMEIWGGTASGTVMAPTFSSTGGTYEGTQTVTISCATVGTSLRYTLDGTMPTATTGKLYTDPLRIAQNTTLKVIAYTAGMTSSPVTTSVYLIQCATPTFTRVVGASGAHVVHISCATPGVTIRYTTDGSTPTATTGKLGTAVVLTQNCTLKVIAVKTGMTASTVAFNTYTIPPK